MSDIINDLKQEYGVAINIKSKTIGKEMFRTPWLRLWSVSYC